MPPRSPAARRSRQSRRPPRRRSWLLLGVPLALLLAVTVLFGLQAWLYSYLRGEAFRSRLDRRASDALRADARFAPLHWTDTEVYSDSFGAAGQPGSAIARLEGEQLRARVDLRALWHGAWRVDSFDVEKLDVVLADAHPDLPSGERPRAAESAHPPADVGSGRGGFFESLLPKRVEFGEVRVNDFSLAWNSHGPASGGRLENVRLSGSPRDDQTWQIDGQGGRLTQAKLPVLQLARFSVKAGAHELFLTHAEAQVDGGGRVELSGHQELDGDRALDLAADFYDVPANGFLPDDWRARMRGNASGTARITGSADTAGGWRASGHVDLRDGQLEALTLLDQLALFTASERYRRAELQKASADFDWAEGNLSVHNLLVESEGLLRVEGAFTVRAGQIDGIFQVGVARSSVRWLPGVGVRVFNLPEREGYVWTMMRLTGPVTHPHEDLTSRLAGAARDEAVGTAKQGADAVIDTAHGLLDLLHVP